MALSLFVVIATVACVNNCNERGVCQPPTPFVMGSGGSATVADNATSYLSNDETAIYGCVCDYGFYGSSCQYRA